MLPGPPSKSWKPVTELRNRGGGSGSQKQRVDLGRLSADYKRQEKLYEGKIISTRDFEAVKADYDAAEARYREVNKTRTL
ncbi:MAG: hypothetical protein HS132_15805 [Planctomycetia bacterium]|nr:hypothetical protein [Planctomycetia bacterium]